MIVYGSGKSRSLRVVWALEEAGVAYDYRKLHFGSDQADGSLSPQYRALNPQGKVPVLIDGDFALTESAAIVNYIARKASERQLATFADPQLAARYDEFAYFVMTELEQPLWSNGKHRFALPKEWRVPQMLETATREFDKALSALEKLFDPNQHAFVMSQHGQDHFTMLDILLAQTVLWAQRFSFEVPAVYAEYAARMMSREAFVRALSVIESVEAASEA